MHRGYIYICMYYRIRGTHWDYVGCSAVWRCMVRGFKDLEATGIYRV